MIIELRSRCRAAEIGVKKKPAMAHLVVCFIHVFTLSC
jgi:hypothetical protein